MHWAAKYIGKPYQLAAEGPQAYDCWGLARAIFKERLGLEMPQIAVRETTNSNAMTTIAKQQKWGPVQDAPNCCDALVMRSALGHHIAVAIATSKGIRFIHADTLTGVEIIPTIADFAKRGYSNIEVWRYDTRTRNK